MGGIALIPVLRGLWDPSNAFSLFWGADWSPNADREVLANPAIGTVGPQWALRGVVCGPSSVLNYSGGKMVPQGSLQDFGKTPRSGLLVPTGRN